MSHYLNDIVVDDVVRQYNVSYSAAVTLKYINRYVNSSRAHGKVNKRGVPYCYASKEKLALKIGKSKRTVARAIAELKAAGLIESRRTRGLSHIYIIGYGLVSNAYDGTSGNATNGTYNNNSYKSYNNSDISVYHDKTQAKAAQVTVTTVDDAKIADPSARIASPAAEKMQDRGQQDSKKRETPKKGVPTPKRPRITKAEKAAAKEKYKKLLEKKLDMTDPLWLVCQEEYGRTQNLIDIIADAMSVKGQTIRVNGASLTVDQYWYVVQNINSHAIEGLIDRLYAADICTRVTNKRAYALAAVYNAVQWEGLTKGANVSLDDLYRHMA